MPIEFKISPDDDGLRVDKFLRREFENIPLSGLHKLIRTRKVRLNEKRAHGNDRLAEGDTLVVRGDPERLRGSNQEAGRAGPTDRRDFEVLYVDPHLVAVTKPAGLAIHPGTGVHGATLVDQVRAWLAEDQSVVPAAGATDDAETRGFLPSPAHRLDRPTSGVVLVARTRQCMAALTEAFTEKTIRKTYLCLVKGKMPQQRGTVELALEERQQTRKSKDMHGRNFQSAVTEWEVREAGKDVSLVEARPRTGRTHQIRRHLASTGHPIVGDGRYGDFPFNRRAKATWGIKGLVLHAWKLELEHPMTGAKLKFTAPIPEALRAALGAVGLKGP